MSTSRNIPIVTILVAALCVILQIVIDRNVDAIDSYTSLFCDSKDSLNIRNIYLRRDSMTGDKLSKVYCHETLKALSHGNDLDKQIDLLQYGLNSFGYGRLTEDRVSNIKREYKLYLSEKPADLINILGHHSGSYKILTILSGSLVHSSWHHLWINLLFFIAFGFAVEINEKRKIIYISHLMIGAIVVGLLDDVLHAYHFTEERSSHGLSVVVCVLAGVYVVGLLDPIYRKKLSKHLSVYTVVSLFFISLYVVIQNFVWVSVYGEYSNTALRLHLYGYFTGAVLYGVIAILHRRIENVAKVNAYLSVD